MRMWLLAAVAGVFFLQCVVGFPSGAPNTACQEMRPLHRFQSPQTSTPPYSISVDRSSYAISGTVSVTISGCGSQIFQGFVLQARRVDVNSDRISPIGFFDIPIGTRIMSGCGIFGQVATHQDANAKQSLTFQWAAPERSEGDVVFVATFLESYTTFWVKVNSGVIQDETKTVRSNVGSVVYPSPVTCQPTLPPPPQTQTPATQPQPERPTQRQTPAPQPQPGRPLIPQFPSSPAETTARTPQPTTTVSRTLPFLTVSTTRRPTQRQTTIALTTPTLRKDNEDKEIASSTLSLWHHSYFIWVTIFSVIFWCRHEW